MLPLRLSDDVEMSDGVRADFVFSARSVLFSGLVFRVGLFSARSRRGLFNLGGVAVFALGIGWSLESYTVELLLVAASCSITAAYKRSISRSRWALSSWITRSSNMVKVFFVGEGQEKFGVDLPGETAEFVFADMGDASNALGRAGFIISMSKDLPLKAFARNRRPTKPTMERRMAMKKTYDPTIAPI